MRHRGLFALALAAGFALRLSGAFAAEEPKPHVVSLPPDWRVQRSVLSTDGKFVIFTCWTDHGGTRSQVMRWNVGADKSEVLMESQADAYHSPHLLDNGKTLCVATVETAKDNGEDQYSLIFRDLATNKDVRRSVPRFHDIAFSPDGSLYLAVIAPPNTEEGRDKSTVIELRDREANKVKHRFEVAQRFGQRAAFAPDGKSFAILADASTVSLVDTRTGESIRTLRMPRDLFQTRSAPAESVAFSPDGKTLAVVCSMLGAGHCVAFFETETGKHSTGVVAPGAGADTFAAYTADGRLVLGTSRAGVYAWNPDKDRLQGRWDSGYTKIRHMSMSGDGQRVAVVCDKGRLAVWEIPPPLK